MDPARGFAALLASCTEVVTVLEPASSALSGDTAEVAWGDYTATLDVPPCPNGEALVVDTTTDELDGGTGIDDPGQAGPALSLVEALWIAANRLGQDNIYFDEGIFAARAPGVIQLGTAAQFPLVDMLDLCIDGRGRGVVVEWEDLLSPGGDRLSLGANALLVGLTFLSLPSWIGMGVSSQIAGCRFGTDGRRSGDQMGAWINAWGGDIGPGNVFAIQEVRVWGLDTWIHDNHFLLDPVTGVAFELRAVSAIDVRSSPAVIERNDFAAYTPCETPTCYGDRSGVGVDVSSQSATLIRNNRFGLRALGREGTSTGGFGVVAHSGQTVVGPGNLMRGLAIAVDLDGTATVRVTRNSIFDNDEGIDGGSPAAPVITSVTAAAVSGACAADGTIELFSDAGSQGETFLGEAPCTAGAFTWIGAAPSARNVTATLTDTTGRTSAFSTPLWVP